MELGGDLQRPAPSPRRKSSSTVDLAQMDRMHHSMVRQMVQAEGELDHEAEIRQRQGPARKTSVSTACQTDKVSRKVSHMARTPPTIKNMSQVSEEMTPVTRCLSHLSTVTHRGSYQETSSAVTDHEDKGGLSQLRQHNDSLVSFIERARVLAEAEQVRNMLPGSLIERTSVSVNNVMLEKMFAEEIAKLQTKMADTEQRRRVRLSELRLLEDENNMLRLDWERGMSELTLMETQLMETEAQLDNSAMDMVDIPKQELAPQADLNFLMPDSRTEDVQNRIIKVKAEYLEKMKAALDLVRKEYKSEYKRFLETMDKESQELLNCIEAISDVRTDKAAAASYYEALRQLEDRRQYPERVRRLEEDIEMLLRKIQDKKGNVDSFRSEIDDVERDMDRLKNALRALLAQFSEYARLKLGDTSELLIYSRLLDFEGDRLQGVKQQRQVTVRESVMRSSNLDVVNGKDDEVPSSDSDSVKSSSKPRRESGYKSDGDKSQDDTLDFPKDRFLSELEQAL